jgi:hypothetical protein
VNRNAARPKVSAEGAGTDPEALKKKSARQASSIFAAMPSSKASEWNL